jgi:hypothetical protein
MEQDVCNQDLEAGVGMFITMKSSGCECALYSDNLSHQSRLGVIHERTGTLNSALCYPRPEVESTWLKVPRGSDVVSNLIRTS